MLRCGWVKRALALCLVVLFLPALAGAATFENYTRKTGYQYVSLGSYPQTEEGEVRPIVWRVLEADDQTAFLFSEYILFAHRVHDPYEEYVAFEGAFNQTEIFGILNGTFKNTAFTQEELAHIVTDEELGSVFLVEAADIRNEAYGFPSKKSRQGYGTAYALANGLFKYSKGSSPYWTRTRSDKMSSGVRCTKVDGTIGYIRCVVMNEGIRPAIRLKVNEVEIASGEGTLENPYVLN